MSNSWAIRCAESNHISARGPRPLLCEPGRGIVSSTSSSMVTRFPSRLPILVGLAVARGSPLEEQTSKRARATGAPALRNSRHVALVVAPSTVMKAFETAGQLVGLVGDVAGELRVSVPCCGADAVLVVAHLGRLENTRPRVSSSHPCLALADRALTPPTESRSRKTTRRISMPELAQRALECRRARASRYPPASGDDQARSDLFARCSSAQ